MPYAHCPHTQGNPTIQEAQAAGQFMPVPNPNAEPMMMGMNVKTGGHIELNHLNPNAGMPMNMGQQPMNMPM